MTQLYVLFEHAVGYCLFKVQEFEEIGTFIPQVEEAAMDPSKFQKVVHLSAFKAFKNAAAALENINSISEGILSNDLSAFLQANMPNPGKKESITLGVGDSKLGTAISETLEYPVTHTGVVPEIIRGIRLHLTHFIKGLNAGSMKQTELGLGHSYSRGKVKFNVNRVDNMIIQSIALVDQLDKDINTFAMRIREWYSYHFPELSKIVTDNYQYSLCANYIKNRNQLSVAKFDKLEEITSDSSKARAILEAGRMSMGMEISQVDLSNIEVFAERVAGLAVYRKNLAEYLRNKMNAVAPNLSSLIGEVVGARLISHAGSLTNLAKYPASTVQILGAEKALFRALKTRGKTPKYGLIFHSSFIGKAGATNKGRISRYLANKCTLASRIDCFSDVQTNVFGQKLKDQVEERLKFYESGELPRKNEDVMSEAALENVGVVKKIEENEKSNGLNGSVHENGDEDTPHKKKKKRKSVSAGDAQEETAQSGESSKKKRKRTEEESMETSMNVSQIDTGDLKASGKKKKKRKIEEDADTSMNNITLDLSMANTTLDNSQVEEGEGELKKKKKKKKHHQDEEGNVTLETSVLDKSMGEDGEMKKKKKKRKSHVEES